MKRNLPYINESPSAIFITDARRASAKAYNEYRTFVNNASLATGVHPAIIVGFMIVENDSLDPVKDSYVCTASKRAKGDCYTGLMQVGAETAYDTIKSYSSSLKPQMASVIQRYLPGFLKVGGVQPMTTAWKLKIYQALKKPEFSIMVGAMHILQLMKATKDADGDFRLDHVIVKYNRGIGNFQKEVVKPGLQALDTTSLVSRMKAAKVLEAPAYIIKFVGKNGSLEIARAAGFASAPAA